MKQHDSHLHIDVTVPFVWTSRTNEIRGPRWLRDLLYPEGSSEANPLASFLENVSAPSNIRVNIHVAVEPTE